MTYQPAERKFKELISGYPESDLLPEAEMLMAYSFYKEGDRASANTTATQLLDAAKKDDDDNIIAYVSILLGQMALEDKNYTLALEHYRDAAEHGNSREQRAFAFLNVADMYIKTGDYAKAEAAFEEERRQSPNYLGEFKGDMGVARMLAKQGKYDESLELLRDLRSDKKNKEFYGEIEFEIANVYRDQGELARRSSNIGMWTRHMQERSGLPTRTISSGFSMRTESGSTIQHASPTTKERAKRARHQLWHRC